MKNLPLIAAGLGFYGRRGFGLILIATLEMNESSLSSVADNKSLDVPMVKGILYLTSLGLGFWKARRRWSNRPFNSYFSILR